jgi:predicted dehydrogenase
VIATEGGAAGTANSNPLPVVLAGCGAVAQLYYTPALVELEKAGELRVVGLVDPSATALATVGRSFPAARQLESTDRLPELGAAMVIVASPPRFHSEHAIQALRSGASVLCEKPMATTTAEAEAMVQAARMEKRHLAVGLVRRFFPATEAIRAALADGLVGDVRSISIFEGGPFSWPVASLDYFDRTKARGGVLLDIGVHVLDLLLWWIGEPDDVTYEDDALGGVEVNCRIRLTFPSGCEADVRLSRDWARPNQYLIRGTAGWLRWEANEADRIEIGFHGWRSHLDASLERCSFQQSFINQIRNVARAIRGEDALLVPGEEGLRSMRLIERCYRSRSLMTMPWLSRREDGRARELAASQRA